MKYKKIYKIHNKENEIQYKLCCRYLVARGVVVSALTSHVGDARFDSRPG